MKKKDKKIAGVIKEQLAMFEKNNPLPEELSREKVTELLKEQQTPTPKKRTVMQYRRVISMAAAFAVFVGLLSAYGLFGGLEGIQKTLDALKGVDVQQESRIDTGKSEAQIIELFKQMSQKRYDNCYDLNFSLTWPMNVKSADGGTPESTAAQNDTLSYSRTGESYGQTNVQVKGIDEPDVMKNDGRYLYTVSGGEVRILSLLPPENVKLVSTLKYDNTPGRRESAESLLVKDNLLVVLGYERTYSKYDEKPREEPAGETVPAEEPVSPASDNGAAEGSESDIEETVTCDSLYWYYSNSVRTVCTVYDLSDITAPKQVKRITQDGEFITARLVGSEVYILSTYSVDIYDTYGLEKNCIPEVSQDGKEAKIPADEINVVKEPEPNYLIVCSADLTDLDAPIRKKAVLGAGSEAYCTADSLFAARTVYSGEAPARDWGADIVIQAGSPVASTEIFHFAIGGKVEYKTSGKVPGIILNQFSMDEYKGYFRIATTSGDWQKSSSNVFVLDKNLKVVGKVQNIAPGEQIFGVRFMGDTGYVITFEQTDPLFVLDLKDPAAPKVVGELKIPGFSSYLHPVTDTLLLGIGQNGNERGTLPGIKLSLFDVSNPARPKEADKIVLSGDSYTEAMNNHRAFLVYPEKGIFAIPVSMYNTLNYRSGAKTDGEVMYSDGVANPDGGEMVWESHTRFVSSFETFTVRDGKILKVRGYRESPAIATRTSNHGGIIRGTYVGDTIYTISAGALTAFDIESGKMLGEAELPLPRESYYY